MLDNMKRALRIGAFALLLVAVMLYVGGEIYKSIDYRERFAAMHGSLAAVQESFVEELKGHRYFSVSLKNDHGISVEGYLKVPAEDSGRYPAFLILGGLRTGRNTLDYVHNTRNMVMLALDYPYEGKMSRMSVAEFISSIPAIRRSVIETVPAALSAIDYLFARDDVDSRRVVVVGGSLGAFFVPVVASLDGRPAAAAMLFGGGDLQAVIGASTEVPRWLAAPVGWIGAVLVSPVEPLKYVADIAPRPVFMLNGTGDDRIPERCGRLLYDAAREPKTIRWIDAGHVNIRDEKFHELVSEELISWLVGQGIITEDCFIRSE
jgi:dipeptidyl aminopeptidase/acylaminoacyl peptidase